jgi:glutamate N-acetyltransferase / amino-acid N-acetyltransferase
MSEKISPFAPKSYSALPPIAGCRLATGMAGVKYKNRTDVMVMVFDEAVTVAGALTTSKCPSAAVDLCRDNLVGGKARALVVNSGNANAFTGAKGRASAESTAAEAAKLIGCKPSEVFVSSTGVIGEPLDAAKINAVLPDIVKVASGDKWHDAARAIMTTDTFPKVASVIVEIDGAKVTFNGFAKGAGMIAPDMATMLAYVVTDAPLGRDVLQTEVSQLVKGSFNAITVDSDTSTSDTLLVFATGQAKLKNGTILEKNDTRIAAIRKALKAIFANLSLQIISDGEGITKLIEVQVTGAKSAKSAKRIALSIANSPLVKTAIGGGDANWGRIVMAVGKAGEPADRDRLAIWFGPHQVASNGLRHAGYSEADVSDYMKKRKVMVRADIGIGKGKAKVWTCDLTQDYVIINGDYRS